MSQRSHCSLFTFCKWLMHSWNTHVFNHFLCLFIFYSLLGNIVSEWSAHQKLCDVQSTKRFIVHTDLPASFPEAVGWMMGSRTQEEWHCWVTLGHWPEGETNGASQATGRTCRLWNQHIIQEWGFPMRKIPVIWLMEASLGGLHVSELKPGWVSLNLLSCALREIGFLMPLTHKLNI